MDFAHSEEYIQEGFEYYQGVGMPLLPDSHPPEFDGSAAAPVDMIIAQEVDDTNWPYWQPEAYFASTERAESALPPAHTQGMLNNYTPLDGFTDVYTPSQVSRMQLRDMSIRSPLPQPSIAMNSLSSNPWFASDNDLYRHQRLYSSSCPSVAEQTGGEFEDMDTAVAVYPGITVMIPTTTGQTRSFELQSAANSVIPAFVPYPPSPTVNDSPIVPQRKYRAKNKMRTPKQLSIRFEVNGQLGISLTDARDDRLQGLLDAGKLVFNATNIGKKVCYRIEWPGYPSFNQHKYARRKKGGSNSVMLAEVAKHVAEVMSAFIKENVEFIPDNEYMHWRVGEGFITVDKLRLLELKQVSAGSFQPVLAVTI
ncbi:hypothetical protein EIP86_005345 [Pleurotus ostreatoroseus]|nr:hypothetical protein EIP86_005345 [Pleurotus ostreatoroseus]